jgi:4-hydroxy-tetrahydrodipicolinate synthase
MPLRSTLRGTGVALVTPFYANLSVDYDALSRLIEFLISNRVEYLVTLGTTGETPTLSAEEKQAIAQFTIKQVAGRVPVVVGIGGNHTQEVVNTLRSFPLEGATAVLSAAPYYNKPSQEGLYQHYKAVAEASPLPVIMYNVPGRTGRNMEASTTLRLANEVENIAGIKEAGNSVQQCFEILRQRPDDFLVVSGDDDLVLAELAGGIDGVISVAGNCYPQAFGEMVRAGLEGNFAKARALNFNLMEVYRLLFTENNPAGVKAFLAELGIIQNHLRLPLTPLSASVHAQVKACIDSVA